MKTQFIIPNFVYFHVIFNLHCEFLYGGQSVTRGSCGMISIPTVIFSVPAGAMCIPVGMSCILTGAIGNQIHVGDINLCISFQTGEFLACENKFL